MLAPLLDISVIHMKYLNLLVKSALLRIIILVVIRVHAQVVKLEFIPDPLFECCAFLQRQAISLGDYRNNIDKITQLFEDDNVNGLEAVASRLDEVQAAMNARILDVALALGCKLLMKVGTVLVLDVFDDWFPASIVVN